MTADWWRDELLKLSCVVSRKAHPYGEDIYIGFQLVCCGNGLVNVDIDKTVCDDESDIHSVRCVPVRWIKENGVGDHQATLDICSSSSWH